MKCVRNITTDTSTCLQQCSGSLITSYESQNIGDKFATSFLPKMKKYFDKKFDEDYDLSDFGKEFQGLF